MPRKTFGQELIESVRQAAAHRRGVKGMGVSDLAIVPDRVDVAAIRKRRKLTQKKFAARYGFDVRALQEWEQGRRTPDRAARILLKVIEKHPEAVEDALDAA
jgi:putative transcriptional regulator